MRDYIFLMHNDTTSPSSPDMWSDYFAILRHAGVFVGGSSVGSGEAFRKQATPAKMDATLSGYIRIYADNLTHAATYLAGNPVFECGGTVEIRELPRD